MQRDAKVTHRENLQMCLEGAIRVEASRLYEVNRVAQLASRPNIQNNPKRLQKLQRQFQENKKKHLEQLAWVGQLSKQLKELDAKEIKNAQTSSDSK